MTSIRPKSDSGTTFDGIYFVVSCKHVEVLAFLSCTVFTRCKTSYQSRNGLPEELLLFVALDGKGSSFLVVKIVEKSGVQYKYLYDF